MPAIARFYQRGKNGVHGLQALLIFIGAAVTIAIFVKGGQGDGRIRYYFALCWLCIPALIYQTAVPIFERTKKFANPYAHAVIDLIYMILWFAAFIGVEVWVRQGSHDAKDWDGKKDKLCDKFAWGPPSKCKLGQGTGIIGVIIWLLFIATTALSIYGVIYYRKHGSLPTITVKAPEAIPADEPEDYTFSANPHDKLAQQEELEPMHREEDGVSSMHSRSDVDYYYSNDRPPTRDPTHQRNSWDRQPSPELPVNRPPLDQRQPIPEQPAWQQRLPRLPTPDLPMGEGFYPVDTSYHGGSPKPYHPPPPPPEHRTSPPISGRTPSPLYDTFHSNESGFVGGMNPRPPQLGSLTHPGVGNPFADELPAIHSAGGGGSDGEERFAFPDGDYHRLGR